MAEEDRRLLQTLKLRRQLTRLAKRSPSYRRKFADASFHPHAVCSLVDLGNADKQELLDSQVTARPLGEHGTASNRPTDTS